MCFVGKANRICWWIRCVVWEKERHQRWWQVYNLRNWKKAGNAIYWEGDNSWKSRYHRNGVWFGWAQSDMSELDAKKAVDPRDWNSREKSGQKIEIWELSWQRQLKFTMFPPSRTNFSSWAIKILLLCDLFTLNDWTLTWELCFHCLSKCFSWRLSVLGKIVFSLFSFQNWSHVV